MLATVIASETPRSQTSSTRLATRVRRVDSRELLHDERELVIEHAGQEYRLRRTRNDKLILTK